MSELVTLAGVSRVFPGQPPVTALAPTDLALHAGDYAAIMGPSGSGKSTLMNLIGLLDTATTGRYAFEGVDTARLTAAERTVLRGERIGFVFQDFYLLSERTALENVMVGLLYRGLREAKRAALALEVLHRVGLSHRTDALPRTLSGGERQRVAIARALARSPGVLLCDEPTGNLDSVTTMVILDLLDELCRAGTTIVLVTHDPGVASRAARHFTVHDGVVTEESGSR